MAKKLVKRKVAKKKTTAVAKVKNELSWVGQEQLMRSPASQAEQRDREMIMSVAKVYNIPALGVNVLANQPYINKDGLLYKLHQHFQVKQIKTEFIKMSLGKNEPAIVRATIIMKDGMEIEGIGEASATNVKLEAVKNMLNQMAETRATNRAIRKAITLKLWDDVEQGLKKAKNINDEDKMAIVQAGSQSYEEMDNQPVKKVAEKNEPVKTNYLEQVKIELSKMGAKTEREALDILKKETGLVWKNFKVTPRQAQMAMANLLNGK